MKVDDHHAVAEIAHLEALDATAAGDEPRHRVVSAGLELFRGRRDRGARPLGVGDAVELHLGDHDRVVGFGLEAAAGADHLRRVGGGGHHRRLLDDHRREVVVAVDPYVEGDGEGQRVGAEDVLDRLVGGGEIEAAVSEGPGQGAHVHPERLRREATSLLDGELVEAR